MTSVYVKEQGARIGKRGERIVISKKGDVIDEFPLSQVEQVVLMGNVQLTTQATATLLQLKIDVVFLSSYGKFRGRLEGEGSNRAKLRQEQLRFLSEEQNALPLAKAVVDGKITNQRVILQRQANRITSGQGQDRGATMRPNDRHLFDKALAGMQQLQQQLPHATTVDSVRGYEGKAAAYYFAGMRSLLDPSWGFDRRAFYPPPDPFNALLSFVYSVLRKDVEAAIQLIGLDVYVGFFHEISYNRPSLALDLMEEWRPIIADALCLELVNRGALYPEDFQVTNNPKRPVILGDAGISRVLQAYGGRLESKLYHPMAGPGGQTTLKQAVTLQARRLAHVITGRAKTYEPLTAK